MSKKDITVIFLLLVLFAFLGCVSGKGREVARIPPASPQDVLEEIPTPDSGDTIRATARITLTSPDGNYSRKMALLIQMFSSLRLETIPLFGPTDFFLSANEESLKVFFPPEGKFYVGDATRETLYLFFRVLLPPADVIPLLVGLPPHKAGGQISGHAEGRLYRVDITFGRMRRSLWVDTDTHILMKIEDREDDRIIWRAEFTEHTVVGRLLYPMKIQIEVKEPERVTVDIRYFELETIPSPADPALFDLRVPPGITPIPLTR